jgi:hypothetical protein
MTARYQASDSIHWLQIVGCHDRRRRSDASLKNQRTLSWYMPRPKKTENPVRRMVSVSAETAKAIAEYRSKQRLPTESEAIHRLIEAGLQQLASKPKKP